MIQLRVRVYNYSLVDMESETAVKVRFYGQPWDHGKNQFMGNSFLIGEDTLAPIPGFNTGTGGDAPNWVFARATFDTSQWANTYLVFWVVVWMEQQGQLVSEIEGHGLTSIPSSNITSITNISITDIPIEDFSNNVGFYKQPFFVCPQEGCPVQTALLTADGLAPSAAQVTLTVESVAVAPQPVLTHEKTEVSARLRAAGDSFGPVLVTFYDGDPAQGGQPFDVELIPFIQADDVYQTNVIFKPRLCGTHTIHVVGSVAGTASATNSTTVEVGCRTAHN